MGKISKSNPNQKKFLMISAAIELRFDTKITKQEYDELNNLQELKNLIFKKIA